MRRGPRVNERIRVRNVRLVDENNEMLGIVDTRDALRQAQDAGLDLVEVSPNTDPPVCRIMDYGKFKYEQSKKEKANKAKSKGGEIKEVRLGRSMKIDPHDIQIRLNQARRFLMEGHKVQIVQNFRGREMHHKQRGHDRMRDIIEALEDLGKVETPPRFAGRRMTMIIAPEKQKVERARRTLEQERAQKSKEELEAAAAEEARLEAELDAADADVPDDDDQNDVDDEREQTLDELLGIEQPVEIRND